MSASVYRMFDKSGALLYIGCAASPSRLDIHRGSTPFWTDVVGITLEHFDKRTDALLAEQRAIAEESPRYNVVYARPQTRMGQARGRDERDERGPDYVLDVDKLIALRQEARLNRTQLAAKASISVGYLSSLESRKMTAPSITIVGRLAAALGVRSWDLFIRVNDYDGRSAR